MYSVSSPQIAHLNMTMKPTEPLSVEKALGIVKDVFISAAERDIYTGDGVLLHIITKEGVKEERFPLRHD
jgi:20S proteasome subunit beta 6